MAVRNIVRAASIKGTGTPTSAPIRIDTSTNTPFYNGSGSGVAEVEIADVSSVQTLTNKTLTAPATTNEALTTPTLTTPQINGTITYNAAAGGVNSYVELVKFASGMADNTVVDFNVPCVVTVPNANHAASVQIELQASLGDQDSTESSFWTIAISRIAGAAAKAVVSAKSGNANTAGVSGNAAATISVAVAGAVGATNTINIQVKVARSAGAATNHDAIASITLVNLKASGCTIA